MKQIFIFPLEKIPNRYTIQWYNEIPNQLMSYINSIGKNSVYFEYPSDYVDSMVNEDLIDYAIINIPGRMPEQNTSTGAFINFGSTNIWKSSQIEQFSQLIADGLVDPGSKIFFTDAWNPGIINVRYMSDLMDLDLELHGIWHAGVHDPHDFLGRNEKVQKWAFTFEKSVFQSLDQNYFASKFYKNMFAETFDLDPNGKRLVFTGHPNEFLFKQIKSLPLDQKENIILFPHRLAPEKQLEIFKDLEKSLPQYQWIVCQENKLTKSEYHDLLAKSKLVWSAALQETHGIAQTEAILANAISFNPDRLSYTEMYTDYFKYPSEWTLSWDSYISNKENVIAAIQQKMDDTILFPQKVMDELDLEKERLSHYLSAKPIWQGLTS